MHSREHANIPVLLAMGGLLEAMNFIAVECYERHSIDHHSIEYIVDNHCMETTVWLTHCQRAAKVSNHRLNAFTDRQLSGNQATIIRMCNWSIAIGVFEQLICMA